MQDLHQWLPYISLTTLVFLMLLGSMLHIQELLIFSAGAALPISHLCLQREADARRNKEK
jgi:hypothetical protein